MRGHPHRSIAKPRDYLIVNTAGTMQEGMKHA